MTRFRDVVSLLLRLTQGSHKVENKGLKNAALYEAESKGLAGAVYDRSVAAVPILDGYSRGNREAPPTGRFDPRPREFPAGLI